MQKNNTIIAAVVVVIVIIAAVGVYYGMNNGGGDNTQNDEGDTYYFYLDGFNDEINGWHNATGTSITAAFDSAMGADNIDYTMSEHGMITIEDYVGTSSMDPDTGAYVGTGTAIYLWTSTDASYFDPTYHYFAQGPAFPNITSNIVYISYSEYISDVDGTTYTLNPSTTQADLSVGGPFGNSEYKPLTYSGDFYFYLDGFSDEINGWYTANGSDITAAFSTAMNGAGISYTMSEHGMITIEDYVGTSSMDPDTGAYVGTGTAIYLWTSTDASYFDPTYHYFAQGPAFPNITSNIVYISYSEYISDVDGTTYTLNPSTTQADLSVGGPFGA